MKLSLFNLAVLISGSGTNLQAIIDAVECSVIPNTKIALVVSNKEDAYGLQRAKKHGILSVVIPSKDSTLLLEALKKHKIDGIVLAGYLAILPSEIIENYKNKIINIHPALLPKHGGMGYYGIKVHESVLKAGDKNSGATAHIVDNGVDTGTILVQGTVPVLKNDTAKTLQKRVLSMEYKVLTEAVKILAQEVISGDEKLTLQQKETAPLFYPTMLKSKRILIIGSGGREHSIGCKLSQNQETLLFFAPGNGGTAQIGENININVDNIKELTVFAKDNKIDLTIVGPELPLTLGIVDEFRKEGLRIFGPDKNAAKLEGSKAFAKQFMKKYEIPTAEYDIVTDINDGIKLLKIRKYPLVIKADGLAAGKGVIICQNETEAIDTIIDIMQSNIFGNAGNKVVIEEYIEGKEVSLLCFTDGKTIQPMETASDYKRALDNDEGLNTGGMGSISPSPYYTQDIQYLCEKIMQKTLTGVKSEGFDYRGVIYIGLMLTKDGPKVLEYNARFGDPETEALLPRLESDLVDVIEAVVDKRLSECEINWQKEKAVCVVLTSKGYPREYKVNYPIEIKKTESYVFHAGTTIDDNKLVTSGGRVLAVTALAESFDKAHEIVYRDIGKIEFEGKTYRVDIGKL